MIWIIVGNLGSGKTSYMVRHIVRNRNKRITFTNIAIPTQKHVRLLKPDMIIEKTLVGSKKDRHTKEENPVYSYKMNLDFWKNLKEPCNIVIDEAHNIINSRRSMQMKNIVIMDWLAMARRVLGQVSGNYGELVFITQLPRRIDIVALELARKISHVVAHYIVQCKDCLTYWKENSEMPEQLPACPRCYNVNLVKKNWKIEVYDFPTYEAYNRWKEQGDDTFYRHYLIHDIADYFKYYSTLQWENFFEQY